ncbi:MAG: oxaloacetate decarboxylase subunit alpha, partial [Clostridia bacterium]|nr:oxaloacetate decarboxylase subunit alpha [Clostridia bacterium]
EYIEQDEDVLSYALLPQPAEKFFKYRIEQRNKKENPDTGNNNEIMAVISAAVASMETEPGTKLIVRSFRRVPQVSPLWSTAGRLQRFQTKL